MEIDRRWEDKCDVKMKKDNVEGNIQKLIEHFNVFRKKTYASYGGPSSYFHIETIKLFRKCKTREEYGDLFDNINYLEKMYATLASWGMQRMGSKGMVEFEEFKKTISDNKEDLIRLFAFRLDNAGKLEKETLGKVFLKLRVMKSKSQFVANSKLLHHLLPDLVIPMDRKHTLEFFGENLPAIHDEVRLLEQEKNIFLGIFCKSQQIYKKIPREYLEPCSEFDTSIPKIIDNAIMGNEW